MLNYGERWYGGKELVMEMVIKGDIIYYGNPEDLKDSDIVACKTASGMRFTETKLSYSMEESVRLAYLILDMEAGDGLL